MLTDSTTADISNEGSQTAGVEFLLCSSAALNFLPTLLRSLAFALDDHIEL